jgi:acetyl esterase/lipase
MTLINMLKINLLILILLPFLSFSQEVKFPLYEGTISNSIAIENTEKLVNSGGIDRISNVTVPELWYYPASKANTNNTCVIICPGGGYSILASSHEGYEVAKKFNEFGVSAFVLKYRLPNDKAQIDKSIAPLQDAQQAIRVARKRANEFGFDNNKIGIMGFSAGGHLAATAGTHFDKPVGETTDTTNVRPDFLILGYPVISFKDFGHKGSANALLGKNPTPEKLAFFSNENHVTKSTPPTFLVHASDDYGVPVKNSLVFYEALVANKVPVEMHLYPKGGHGFGMVNKFTKELWMDRLKNWMDSMGWLK